MLKDFSGTEFLDIQKSGYPDDLTLISSCHFVVGVNKFKIRLVFYM